VIQTVGGAILSLVSVVFTAALAAYTFIAHLAREAADLGGQLLARVAAALVSIGDTLLTAMERFVQYIIGLAEAAVSLMVAVVETALNSYLSGVLNATESMFAQFSASQPTLVGELTSIASFFLSILDLTTIFQSVSQALSSVFTFLKPVLSLLNPVTLATDIAQAIAGAVGSNAISTILNDGASFLADATSGVTNGIVGMLGSLGVGTTTIQVRNSRIPSVVDGNLNTLVTGIEGDLSSQAFTSDFGSGLLSASTNPATILDGVHIGTTITLMAYLFQYEQAISSALTSGASGMFYGMFNEIYGGPVEGRATLTQGILVDSLGLVVSLLSTLLKSQDDLYKLVVGSIGAAISTYGVVYAAVPIGEGGWPIWALTGIELGSSWATPIIESTSHGF
jgi:hypothetical protein